MCRYMAIAQIFLFLSIFRFALAAPIVVRQVPVNVVDVAEDGAPTSTKAADQTSMPMIPAPQQLQDFDHFPRSSTESNSAPSSPESTNDSHPPYYYGSPLHARTLVGPDGSPPTDHSPAPAPAPAPYHWSPPSTLFKESPPPYYWSPPSASSSPEQDDSFPADRSPPPSPHRSPPSTLFKESPKPFYWSPPSASSSPEQDDPFPTDHSPPPPPPLPPPLPPPPPPSPPPPHRSPPGKLFKESPPPFYWSPPSASSPSEPDDSPSTDRSSPSNPDRPIPEPLQANPAEKSAPEDFLYKLLQGKIKRHNSASRSEFGPEGVTRYHL